MIDAYHADGDGCVTTRCLAGNVRWRACYNAPVLTGKQRRHLRALGHDLRPIVQVGRDGIDDGLVAAIDRALADHELVKIKVAESAALDRHDAATDLAARTRSEVAQVLGNTVLLYRPDPDDPEIELPRGKPAASDAGDIAENGDDDDATSGDA
jgi:RNA-binding protein